MILSCIIKLDDSIKQQMLCQELSGGEGQSKITSHGRGSG